MTREIKRRRAKARQVNTLSEVVLHLISEIEEPLHEATHLICVISSVETNQGGSDQSIAFVAGKAHSKLQTVNDLLQRIFMTLRNSQ
jgi:hypothetical protein